MNNILAYAFEVIVVSAIGYGLYYGLLRAKKPFLFVRIYLLGLTIGSLLIPLLPPISIFYSANENKPLNSVASFSEKTFKQLVQPVSTAINAIPEASLVKDEGIDWVLVAYLLGAVVAFTVLLRQLYVIIRYIKSLHFIKSADYHVKVARVVGDVPSFSFFDRAVINTTLSSSSEEEDIILNHEAAHIRQVHWLDLALLEMARIIGWYNPFFYLIQQEVKHNHEYLADEAVLQKNPNYPYASFLAQIRLKQAGFTFYSTFNFSTLNRIKMITKNTKPQHWRSIVASLAIIVLFMAFSCETEQDLSSSYNYQELNDNAINAEISVMPEGGYQAYSQILKTELKYPDEAKNAGVEGTVYIRFIVDEAGATSDFHSVKESIGYGLEEEAIRVLKTVTFEPAVRNGERVASSHVLPVRFRLASNNEVVQVKNLPNNTDVIEAEPVEGGEKAHRMLMSKMAYPEEAKAEGKEGDVYLQFKVLPDGSTTEYTVILGETGYGFPEEAIRLLKTVEWKPATMNGKPISSMQVWPIRFKLK